jgi:PEP-CTERM motif
MKFATSAGLSALIALALCFGAPTSSQAGFNTPVGSIETVVTPTAGGYKWDYRVTLTSGAPIGAIEIPEVSAGDLQVTLALPGGWSGTQISSPAFADPILKSGDTPGAWILLTTNSNDNAILQGDTLNFNLFSTLGGQALAQVSASYFDISTHLNFTVDPATPTSTPEPGTWVLMGLGALGLIALRRRKALVGSVLAARA